MSTYPIVLNNLECQAVVVVGGGQVAEDKVMGLLEAGARQLTVISPELTDRLARLAAAGRIVWLQRAFQPGDLTGHPPFLVIAATDDPQVNRAVAEEARRQRVLVNVVDDPASCDFYAVSVVRQGGLTISIGTDGQMPALAVRLRQRLGRGFGPEYGRLIELARELRPEIARRFPDPARRRRVWHALADAPLIAMLRRGEPDDVVRAAMVRLVESFECVDPNHSYKE